MEKEATMFNLSLLLIRVSQTRNQKYMLDNDSANKKNSCNNVETEK